MKTRNKAEIVKKDNFNNREDFNKFHCSRKNKLSCRIQMQMLESHMEAVYQLDWNWMAKGTESKRF